MKKPLPNNVGFIDSYWYPTIIDPLVNIAYKLNLRPNIITTITLIIRLFIIYSIYYNKNKEYIVPLFTLSWITDCMDGHLAKQYDLVTKFGAIYDVLVDIFTCCIIFFLIYCKYYQKNKKPFVIFVIVLILCFIIGSLKTKCYEKKNLKIWQEELQKYDYNFDKEDCEDYSFIKLYDESVNYVVIILFLIYTLY